MANMVHIMVYKLDGDVQEQKRHRNEESKSDILNGYTCGKNISQIYAD